MSSQVNGCSFLEFSEIISDRHSNCKWNNPIDFEFNEILNFYKQSYHIIPYALSLFTLIRRHGNDALDDNKLRCHTADKAGIKTIENLEKSL